VFASYHGNFDPTSSGIFDEFQDGRRIPYSWTMDNGDSFNELCRSDRTLFVASSGEIYTYNEKLDFLCSGSIQGQTGLMLSVIYTTNLGLEATYGFACQKYTALNVLVKSQWIAHELAAS
jgi:hypothetical protein